MATHLGFADAVFMPSGVMAQEIALLINNGDKLGSMDQEFICHSSSHLLIHEKDGFKHLLNMNPIIIRTEQPLNFKDVNCALLDSAEGRVKTVMLEHPHRELGGSLTSFEDLKSISELCKEKRIKFHLDGARIWEAAGAYNGKYSAKDICKLFDSAYCSFYKGLDGLAGSMLLGSKEFCVSARVWLRRFGGNLFTLAPYAITAMKGFHSKQMRVSAESSSPFSFVEKANKLKRLVRLLMGDVEVSKVLTFSPKDPQVCMVHVIIQGDRNSCQDACEAVFNKTGVRVFSRLRQDLGDSQLFEWTIGVVCFHILCL